MLTNWLAHKCCPGVRTCKCRGFIDIVKPRTVKSRVRDYTREFWSSPTFGVSVSVSNSNSFRGLGVKREANLKETWKHSWNCLKWWVCLLSPKHRIKLAIKLRSEDQRGRRKGRKLQRQNKRGIKFSSFPRKTGKITSPLCPVFQNQQGQNILCHLPDWWSCSLTNLPFPFKIDWWVLMISGCNSWREHVLLILWFKVRDGESLRLAHERFCFWVNQRVLVCFLNTFCSLHIIFSLYLQNGMRCSWHPLFPICFFFRLLLVSVRSIYVVDRFDFSQLLIWN